MGTHAPQALAPAYLHRFHCIGSACEETCCNGWQIDMEKATFQRYKSIPIKALATQVESCVTKLPNPSSRRYAVIKLDDKGNCPLLDAQQLCGLHSQLGPEYLSHTCRDYPRSFSRNGNAMGAHASLSCPETARLALLAPDAMDMSPLSLGFANEDLVPLAVMKRAPGATSDAIQTHADLLNAALRAIQQVPFLDATHAVVIGGLIVRQAARAAQDESTLIEQRNAVAALIARYLDADTLMDARQRHQQLDTPREPQLKLLIEIAELYHGNAVATSFRSVLGEALEGLKQNGDNLDAIVLRYAQAQTDWVEPYLAAHPHVLKNYVINHLGKSLFPATDAKGVEDEYLSLCVRLAFLRFCLVGTAAKHQGTLTNEQVVKVTYTFARRIEHNATFLPEIEAAIRKAGFGSLGMMATLLR